MSDTLETGNQHQNTPSASDLDAQLAADEAARNQPEFVEPEAQPEPEPQPEVEPEPEQDPEEDDHAKRIERLAFERREARRRVKELEERLAKLEQPGEPSDETDDQRIERRAAAMTAANAYNEKANAIYQAGLKDYADFETKMAPLRELGLTPALVEAADEVGDPHKLLYFLGKNIDEAERIMGLPAHKMGAALAKLAPKAMPPRQQSKAPPPIKPLGGSGRAELSPEDMPIDQYMKQEDERWYNRRR